MLFTYREQQGDDKCEGVLHCGNYSTRSGIDSGTVPGFVSPPLRAGSEAHTTGMNAQRQRAGGRIARQPNSLAA